MIVQVNREKLQSPSQLQHCLGFVLDSVNLKIKFDENKLHEIRWLLDTLDDEVEIRVLAKIIGKLLALAPACSMKFSTFLARSARFVLSLVNMDQDWPDWDRKCTISYEVTKELEWVYSRLKKWNGRDIAEKTGVVYHYQLEEDQTTAEMYAGDATVDCGVVYNIYDKKRFRSILFPVHIRMLSSSHKELYTILAILRGPKAPSNTKLVYITDNRNVSNWINSGTIREKPASILREIYIICHRRKLSLTAAWCPRSNDLIKTADLTIRLSTDGELINNDK